MPSFKTANHLMKQVENDYDKIYGTINSKNSSDLSIN